MNKLPLVSIPLICYNQENFIEIAVRSVLEQTYDNIELIISDDCSTDKTVELIKDMLIGSSIKYHLNINDKNIGIGSNLSKAIGLCNGEFIVPASGDDISHFDRVEKLVNHWLKVGEKIGYINTDLIKIDKQGNELSYLRADSFTNYPNINRWINKPQFNVGAEAFSREFYNKFPAMHNVTGEDQIFAFRAIILGAGSTIHEPTIKHRIGGISSKKIFSYDQKIDRLVEDANRAILDYDQILIDAEKYASDVALSEFIAAKILEAKFTISIFEKNKKMPSYRIIFGHNHIKLGKKIRFYFYITAPTMMKFLFLITQSLKSYFKV
jgi:glycosyltransferase involved in cell wall biosynthesis